MKKGISLTMILFMGVLALAEIRAHDRRSDEAIVRALDEQVRVAVLNRDISVLELLWSDQLVVNAPNNQVVIGKNAVIDDFVRAGVINFSSLERRDNVPAIITRQRVARRGR